VNNYLYKASSAEFTVHIKNVQPWPQCSSWHINKNIAPDLTSLDYNLQGHLKDMRYQQKSEKTSGIYHCILHAATHVNNNTDEQMCATC